MPKKITVKTPSKTPAKVAAKAPVKKVADKEKISTTKKPESTKVITAKKDVPKKSTATIAQENTSTIT